MDLFHFRETQLSEEWEQSVHFSLRMLPITDYGFEVCSMCAIHAHTEMDAIKVATGSFLGKLMEQSYANCLVIYLRHEANCFDGGQAHLSPDVYSHPCR